VTKGGRGTDASEQRAVDNLVALASISINTKQLYANVYLKGWRKKDHSPGVGSEHICPSYSAFHNSDACIRSPPIFHEPGTPSMYRDAGLKLG